jgi:hypothetical protein
MRGEGTEWRAYEEVATHLLNEFAAHFGLGRVEGKTIVPGASGTKWQIEAKGVLLGHDGFFIVECKRYTSSRLSQEDVGALAYRITDTGAAGGILVTPLDLQRGALRVARAANIKHVRLAPDSTTTEYILRLLNDVFLRRSDELGIGVIEAASVRKFDGDVSPEDN